MSSKVGKNTFPQKGNMYSLLYVEDEHFPVWDPLDSLSERVEELPEISIYELSRLLETSVDVCHQYNVEPSISRGNIVHGMEVGDDRVDASLDSLRLAFGLVVQERVLHMQTSHEDTCISNSVWNFCEVTNGIPVDESETFDYCRKNNGFEKLGFVDAPPLRIILDVTKGDGSHSSTASGKAAMLGTRMRTPRAEFLRMLHLSSFIQDGMLRTSMSSDPKYLPRIMGGSGCRSLFDSDLNLYLYTLAYRGGRCNRVYGSATRELQNCLRELSRDRASMPVLCRMLSDKQEYLHGTYAGMIFAPKYSYKDVVMEKLPAPLIEAPGGANRFNSVLNRLVRTRKLVTRTVAVREWEYTASIRGSLLSRISSERLDFESGLRKAALRRRFGDALCANTAFANLLQRKANWKDVERLLGSDQHITLTSGAPEFTLSDAQWLVSGAKYENFSIEDLTITEDLHSREDVSEEQTFKVGGILLRPIVGDKIVPTRTTTKIGMYEISSSMEEWAEKIFRNLLACREEGKPIPRDTVLTEIMKDPEWVNDDTGLIELCLRDTQSLHQRSARVVLVSQDKRLANQMSNTCNVQVERLHPLSYILRMLDAGLDPIRDKDRAFSLLGKDIPSRERSDPVRSIYVDTGSVASALTNMSEEGEGGSGDYYLKSYLSSVTSNDGTRKSTYTLRKIPNGMRPLNTVPHRPILRDRKFPHRQSSGYSRATTDSWRSPRSRSSRE